MHRQIIGLSLVCVLSLASGDISALQPTPVGEATMLTFNAKVVYQTLEGGFWGLIDDAGERYVPENLAPAFQQDGLRVTVHATLAEEGFGIQMWGTRIHLLDIEKLTDIKP